MLLLFVTLWTVSANVRRVEGLEVDVDVNTQVLPAPSSTFEIVDEMGAAPGGVLAETQAGDADAELGPKRLVRKARGGASKVGKVGGKVAHAPGAVKSLVVNTAGGSNHEAQTQGPNDGGIHLVQSGNSVNVQFEKVELTCSAKVNYKGANIATKLVKGNAKVKASTHTATIAATVGLGSEITITGCSADPQLELDITGGSALSKVGKAGGIEKYVRGSVNKAVKKALCGSGMNEALKLASLAFLATSDINPEAQLYAVKALAMFGGEHTLSTPAKMTQEIDAKLKDVKINIPAMNTKAAGFKISIKNVSCAGFKIGKSGV